MPWRVEKEGDEFVVVKLTDGKVVGRHKTRGKALAQQRALYASESRIAKMRAVLKARSFGGDRSAAGRYAAGVRWADHVRDAKPAKLLNDLIQEHAWDLTNKWLDGTMLGESLVKRGITEDDLMRLASHTYPKSLVLPNKKKVERMGVFSFENPLFGYSGKARLTNVMQGKNGLERLDVAGREFVTDMVVAWHHSAQSTLSLLVKDSIRRQFGVDWRPQDLEAMKKNKWTLESLEKVLTAGRERDTFDAIVAGMYEATQTLLKSTGGTHVRLYRGTTGTDNPSREYSPAPLSAWSTDRSIARKFRGATPDFKHSSTLLRTDVPVKDVFLVAGFGPAWKAGLGEKEVIVVGRPSGKPMSVRSVKVAPWLSENDVEQQIDDDELWKARSFGGNRSEAGRYAANVRWQNHTLAEAKRPMRTSEESDRRFRERYGQDRPQGDGDCFEAAVRVMSQLTHEEKKRARICHGVPMGQGEIEGVRFDHAWVEVETDMKKPDGSPFYLVYDHSNGRELVLPRDLYYEVGQMKEEDVKRYTASDAIDKMNETGIYGPWN
jgi:hypothetical protein